jgi:hypothetical protein
MDADGVGGPLDPSRRTLLVEGRRDRLFLLWMAGSYISRDAQILESDMIECSNAAGGSRGRCLTIAAATPSTGSYIRVFVDADWDKINERLPPESAWLTDFRDLESYTLRVECFEKMLLLGIASDRRPAAEVLESILREGRSLGALRILSDRRGLSLPFQETDLFRYCVSTQGLVSVRRKEYLQTLLQNAEISIGRLDELTIAWKGAEEELASWSDLEMVHGKDAVAMISRVVKDLGGTKDTAGSLLMTAYERRFALSAPTLVQVLNFIGAQPMEGVLAAV